MLTGVPFDVVLEGDENQKFSLKDDRSISIVNLMKDQID